MKLVSNCELRESLGLEVGQFLTSVVDGSADPTLLPESSLHVVVLGHLGDDLCVGHAFSRQGSEDLGTRHSDNDVILDLLNHNAGLFVNLGLNEGNVKNLFGHLSCVETEGVLKSISKDGVDERKEVTEGGENNAELVSDDRGVRL